MTKESNKPLIWLKGEIKTPPFSSKARVEVFLKKTPKTPPNVIEMCQKRLQLYDNI